MMSRELKLYVPVVTVAIKGRKKTSRITMLNVNNCTTFHNQLPAVKDIREHLEAQKAVKDAGGQYTSIKVSVSPEVFAGMCKEIGHKMGARYTSKIIDLIMQVGQIPIIQIIENQNEKEQEQAVEVKKASVADEQSSKVSKDTKEVDVEI
jgi:hypothetical protein